MRVCLVSIHPRLLSGQINSLVGLATALRERDHEVRLVTAFAQDHILDNDRIRRPEANAGVLVTRLTRVPDIIWRLRAEAEDADVVQVNLPTPGFSLLGDAIQSLLGRPIVVGFEMHLSAFREVLGPRVIAAPRFYLPQLSLNNRALAQFSGFHAARYVVASTLQANELTSLGVPPERTSIIPNVVDVHHVGGDFADDEVAWPSEHPIISYVGHFNHVKGVDVLIRAFPEVLRAYPNARLVLAWSGLGPDGPIRAAIRRAGVEDRVQIVGRLPLGGILRRSDVLALPYRLSLGQATYPSLLLEALATGIPLVTSDLPLFHEILRDGETAEMARPEDASDLARGIIRLVGDPGYRADMVRQQRLLSHRALEPGLLAHRYEAMYEDVIAAPKRAGAKAHILSSPVGSGRV